MDAATAALMGAFGGAGLGFLGTLTVNARQRREARRSEIRRALADFLGALYPAVAELREMPSNKEPDAFSKAIDRLSGDQATWVRTRRGLLATSPHIFGRMDRLAAAFARVQLLDVPVSVMEAVEKANDYVAELGEERSIALIERWPAIRSDLISAVAAFDSPSLSRWRRLFQAIRA